MKANRWSRARNIFPKEIELTLDQDDRDDPWSTCPCSWQWSDIFVRSQVLCLLYKKYQTTYAAQRSPRGTVCRGPNLTSGEVWFCHGERIGHPQSQVVEVGDPGIGEHAMNIGGQGVKKGDVLSRRDQMDLPSNLRWQYNYDAPTPDQNTRSFFSI